MEKIIAAAILVASFSTSAQADSGFDLGKVAGALTSIGSLSGEVQVGVAVESENYALGEDAVAIQGSNINCESGPAGGKSVSGQIAVAVGSTNLANGGSATAIQASNINGNVNDCVRD